MPSIVPGKLRVRFGSLPYGLVCSQDSGTTLTFRAWQQNRARHLIRFRESPLQETRLVIRWCDMDTAMLFVL